MAKAADVDRALARVMAELEREVDALADAATGAIFGELPGYADGDDGRLQASVHKHARQHMATAVEKLRTGADVTREDFLFIRGFTVSRVGRVSVSDFIASFHVGQQVLWHRMVELGSDDVSRQAVLRLVPRLVRYFEVATVHAAEIYVEAEQLLATTTERLRRDVLDDLLAAVVPGTGAEQDLLHDAGLRAGRPCLVLSAVPVTGEEDENALRAAGSALGRAFRRAALPLTVLRHSEIVLVAPAPENLVPLVERLGSAQRGLASGGVALAIGVSTVHQDLVGVADAYREAVGARERLRGGDGDGGGVVALPTMSLLDYLTLAPDPTARRLLPAALQSFVAEDQASGGALVDTVEAYAAADLNVKEAAKALHVHVNTAHYRLARVAERTGMDLRRINDVLTLVIAARLGAGAGGD